MKKVTTEELFEKDVREICEATVQMLLAKNKAYGNSALDPVRVFSQAATDEQMRVRLDDKLSRIARGQVDAFGEDPYADIRGYLVLLEIHRRRNTTDPQANQLPETPPSRVDVFGAPSAIHAETHSQVPSNGMRSGAQWRRVPESLAVTCTLDGVATTLLPGEEGYDEVARTLGVPGVK